MKVQPTQKETTTETCAWDNPEACATAMWIIAWICDRCETQGLHQICDDHYALFSSQPAAARHDAGVCDGTISTSSRRITGERGTEIIH